MMFFFSPKSYDLFLVTSNFLLFGWVDEEDGSGDFLHHEDQYL